MQRFYLGSVEVARVWDRSQTVAAVRKTTLGEEGECVVVGVDRYDGTAKRLARFLRHVVSKQDHVPRRAARPAPAGLLLALHRSHVQLQIYAWNRLLGM